MAYDMSVPHADMKGYNTPPPPKFSQLLLYFDKIRRFEALQNEKDIKG